MNNLVVSLKFLCCLVLVSASVDIGVTSERFVEQVQANIFRTS